jgi:hypothetical protein
MRTNKDDQFPMNLNSPNNTHCKDDAHRGEEIRLKVVKSITKNKCSHLGLAPSN